MTFDTPFAAAAGRNAGPILGILRRELPPDGTVLEIGSGTAQHAVGFARALPGIRWQSSDVAENLPGIRSRLESARLPNLAAPIEIDAERPPADVGRYDHAYSSNTAHIMSKNAVRGMFALLGKALRPGGLFCLYGPFRLRGAFTTESNAEFDAMLRSQNPRMGIRDIEFLDELADGEGMRRLRRYTMPSNNLLVIWKMR